jgi:hypothetical protein
MESYIIKITGDVRQIIPSVNNFLEGERRRLRRKGIYFNVDREFGTANTPKPENKPDIVVDYL